MGRIQQKVSILTPSVSLYFDVSVSTKQFLGNCFDQGEQQDSLQATETSTSSAGGGLFADEDLSFCFSGCEEELEGLTQDWISLNKCRAELIRRKRDLEMM